MLHYKSEKMASGSIMPQDDNNKRQKIQYSRSEWFEIYKKQIDDIIQICYRDLSDEDKRDIARRIPDDKKKIEINTDEDPKSRVFIDALNTNDRYYKLSRTMIWYGWHKEDKLIEVMEECFTSQQRDILMTALDSDIFHMLAYSGSANILQNLLSSVNADLRHKILTARNGEGFKDTFDHYYSAKRSLRYYLETPKHKNKLKFFISQDISFFTPKLLEYIEEKIKKENIGSNIVVLHSVVADIAEILSTLEAELLEIKPKVQEINTIQNMYTEMIDKSDNKITII